MNSKSEIFAKLVTSIVLITSILMFAGCATRIGDFTIISSKNINYSNFDEFEVNRSRSTGEDIKFFGYPSMEEAVDRAIESVNGGVAITDATVEMVYYFFSQGYRVEGNVVVDPDRKINY